MKKMLVAALILVGWCTISQADSLNVRTLGVYATPGDAKGVVVSGSYAYVADDSAGLRIINISDPAHPTETGFYDTPGTAWKVVVSGSYAYVADEGAGLRIINISDPAHPTETGFYDTPGSAQGVDVKGNYAYVADGASLRIINISDPANPTEAGVYDTLGYYMGVATSSIYPYAYVVNGNYGLQVLNINVPATPGEVGFYDTPGWAGGVASSGNYIYVADGFSGLRILDLGGGLHEVGYYDTPSYAQNVAVFGSFAYVADAAAGLRVINISNPASPMEAGFYDTPGSVYAVAVSGSLVYVADGDSGLRILQYPIPPIMELNTAQHDFGSVTIGDSLAWNGFYIRNIGSLPFSIESLKFATGNCWADPPSDSTVAPGDSIQITLWFKPDFIGSIVDTVTVYSGEAENSPLKAGLTGTGVPVIEVIDVPYGTVPKIDGTIEPAEWADAYCDTFRILNKTKAFIPDSFWVKYNQDTLYLVLKTPIYATAGIAVHHLLFDILMNRTEMLEKDDIRLSVLFSGESVEYCGNKNWEKTAVSMWRSDYSAGTDLITEFVVPFSKIGITAGTADSVGFSVFADGAEDPFDTKYRYVSILFA